MPQKIIFACLLISGLFISCKNNKSMNQKNPLLLDFITPYQTAPFNDIKPEHYMPAFLTAMEKGRSEIAAIIANSSAPTFSNTIEMLENSGKLLGRISNIFFNINSAETNEDIQSIAREVSPLLSEYANDIWLNEALFNRVKQVYDGQDTLNLTTEQQMLLNNTYKAFVRQGALLNEKDKNRYREITGELSKLTVEFGENVLAETNDYRLHITNENDLAGLPDHVKEAAAMLAKSENKEGWLFSLQAPSYLAFMKYADNRALREELFKAYSSRGNRNNERDNKDNIIKQARLRLEKARLLGYKSHADYVLEERMAQSPEKVNTFLDELFEKSFSFASNDVKEVAGFAKNQGLNEPLQRWDFSYYSEKLKSSLFDLNDEMVKPYFELTRVTDGIFNLTNKLWGLTYKHNPEIPVYHSDVKAYEVFDKDGKFLSVLYLDFHPRSSKQGGAWMTSYKEQFTENGIDSRPHISLVCNFTAPTETKPSLLTYYEVTTFLHEFGHGLHGMLSAVNYESLSGTNVYRDFVELPSQIMENWAREKEWLQEVAVHYETGETIPDQLVDKIIAAGNFQSGYFTVRQLSFGFNDMAWHNLTNEIPSDVIAFERKAMERTELFPIVEGTSLSTAFAHIFDGGYAAGYYGYKWAEVLDADAFALFKQNGIFDKTTADSFRANVLSKGGTEHPMSLYVKFRGHEPSIQPLLERSGLIK